MKNYYDAHGALGRAIEPVPQLDTHHPGRHREIKLWESAAENIRTLREMEKYLCEGFRSQCPGCPILDKCRYGQEWLGRFRGEKLISRTERDTTSARKRRAELEAAGLCNLCGGPLDNLYYKTCSRCRQRKNRKGGGIR